MTRSAPASLLIILAALLFAAPVFADHGDYSNGNWYNNNDRDWRHDRDDDRIPSCEITISPNTIHYGGRVTLSWDSWNADYAEITDIGRVGTEGSHTLYPTVSKTYYMTVYNDGRTSECDTFVNILGDRGYGNYPYNTYGSYQQYPYTYNTYVPYVSLTQIPYTGFDFGPVGNSIYWVTLAGLAIGMAYLLIYQSGIQALAALPIVSDTVQAGRMQVAAMRGMFSRQRRAASPAPAPIVRAQPEQTLAVTSFGGDSMKVVEGAQPRIVITRS